ncbi:MAG: cofactor-independent phosphoglycerate mutase [Candidatus Omnitrophica bacterium]|jgi:2,3-bisphosphoglycerate-independent phosphoglycerate mutase|nr:cofactor-independent phosphoglycerate mutase [Candidatus Omnitrophota bacterium]
MKYIILVGDGMADYPVEELGGRTPLEAARTPNMDFIARHGILGQTNTIPEKMTPASDVANMSILGCDPKQYYSGRGPLEAANMGVELGPEDVAFRCNLVTTAEGKMKDYSAGHITSKEAAILIKAIDKELGKGNFKFYPGISYRHLMLAKEGTLSGLQNVECKAPHDILGQDIDKNLPRGNGNNTLIDLMQRSVPILEKQEINQVRLDLHENPANMIWLWGQGKKPLMPNFQEKYGLTGSVISAVDLIKGLGKILGLHVIDVPGATGYYDTDYEGKANAAIKSLKTHDFVFVHVEAPDEAGHNGDLREKITAIERFDQLVVGKILEAFKQHENYRILVMPDHATPVSLRTHTADTILFGIFGKGITGKGFAGFNEKEAKNSQIFFPEGHKVIDFLIKEAQ